MKKLLTFPVQFACPTCQRPCSEADLSGCMTCDKKFCKHDSWECDCDRRAAALLRRVPQRVGIISTLLALVCGGAL